MAQLVVRNLDDELVGALKRRAASKGRSAEAEHREILKQVLSPEPEMDFKTYLMSMPDVGEDWMFERSQGVLRDVEW